MSRNKIKLASFRLQHGLTQEQMAQKVGLTRANYSMIECGARHGSFEFWKRLQDAFNISDSDMWGLMNEEQQQPETRAKVCN